MLRQVVIRTGKTQAVRALRAAAAVGDGIRAFATSAAATPTLAPNGLSGAFPSHPLNAVDVQLRERRNEQDRGGKSSHQQHRDPSELWQVIAEDERIQSDLAYCLSFASEADSDSVMNFGKLFPDARMKRQLSYSDNQLKRLTTAATTGKKGKADPASPSTEAADTEPLPATMYDALRPSRRAIVITEAVAPFRVWDVNRAWEDLCGYSHIESKGKTLGELLSGPETDSVAATSLIGALLKGEKEAGVTLTNYTKDGRRFRNRVRVGPLVAKDVANTDDLKKAAITHFVGVLQEIKDGM